MLYTLTSSSRLLMLSLLPFLSLIYATVVAIFLFGWGEDSLLRLLRPCIYHFTLCIIALAHYMQIQDNARKLTEGAEEPVLPMTLVLTSIVTNFAAIYLIRFTRRDQVEGGPAPRKTSMQGKVVLITGANAGIGKETALQFLQMGAASVIMACRSLERAKAAKDDLIKTLKGKDGVEIDEQRIQLLQLDLSSCRSVRQAAATVKQTMPKIHVLINNAGIMMGEQAWTDEKHELVMQANHLGHFLFTLLLLDHLVVDDDARILNVTSSTYTLMDGIDIRNDLFCTNTNGNGRPYSLFGQYAASKLANILFTQSLCKVEANTKFSAHAIHPGLVRTDVTRNMPWFMQIGNRLLGALIQTLQKTPPQGAWCTVAVASMPRDRLDVMEQRAQSCYWVNRRPQKLQAFAQDNALMDGLWKQSCELVGLDVKYKFK
ncbi:hypothetical protein MPSEU_000858000 [Mayamaea pseudoterrestris]|nr:hypothetical protein MPSEU_000858000 [Mayamaea pseudoterrestris]